MEESNLHEYFFTFSLDDPEHGGGKYCRILATDYEAARAVMVEHFDLRWAFQYNSAEEAGVDRFYLTEIDLSGKVVL